MSESDKPALIPSIVKMKCPNCRRGDMYINKSIFPLKTLLKMPEHCPVCGQKMELEVGFYYGTGYVSYALTLVFFFLAFIFYWFALGISYKDNSIFYYLISTSLVTVFLQPWLMRMSRVIYLYFFVKYGKGTLLRSEE